MKPEGKKSSELVASIIEQFKQEGVDGSTQQSLEVLHRLVQEWEYTCAELGKHLEMARRSGAAQAELIDAIRAELEDAKAHVYAVEQRALEVESWIRHEP